MPSVVEPYVPEPTPPVSIFNVTVPLVPPPVKFVPAVTPVIVPVLAVAPVAIPSSLLPSADTSLPSTLPEVIKFGTVTSPVKVAPVKAAKPVPET